MAEFCCPICLSPPEDPVSLCVDCYEPLCRSCWISYMNSKLTTAYMGTCPVIACPSVSHHKAKRRRLISFKSWQSVMPKELSARYSALANSLLAFLCGGCHSLKSLDLGYEPNRSSPCYEKLTTLLTDANGDNRMSHLEEELQRYAIGSQSTEELYDSLHKTFFPTINVLGDSEAWDIFCNVLKAVADPERRANLHLRYLRDRPRIKTLCCNREHCFRCKVKDFHDGKTCMENINTLDHSIVHCPTCGIALAKGDGCNTVTCVCGKQFSWSAEKESTERCQQFVAAYPSDTTVTCANLLCTRLTSSQMTLARAWQTHHRVAVNQALKELYKKTYWPCPNQCVTVLPFDTMPEGWREAAELWRQEHSTKVEKCREQNSIALRSIFHTLCPYPPSRAVEAHRIIVASRKSHGLVNPRLVQSANMWIESHKAEYAQGIEGLDERSAAQFLFLFGDKPIKSLKPAFAVTSCAMEWNRDISNPDLTYSNNNTTVERVGSVSCYPAAFANLVAERSTFRVMVDTAPRTSNWLTFGVARRGMVSSSSDGVGRTPSTWGISDDRSSSANTTIVAASGNEVGSMRKLRPGDVLMATIDTTEGWCEVCLNDVEFMYRFEGLPIGTRDEYWFAMSFANDHRVTILSDAAPVTTYPEISGALLNPDHTTMFCNLKKQLKKIFADREGDSLGVPRGGLIAPEREWIYHCGGDDKAAFQAFDQIRGGAQILLGLRSCKDEEEHTRSLEMVQEMTYQSLLYAVSWYRHNHDRIHETMKMDSAMSFKMIHGDDAAFIAAISLMDYHSTKLAKDEQQAALAYMHIFSDEMQEWYDYDAASKDAVVEGVARGCRCLPRHMATCSCCK